MDQDSAHMVAASKVPMLKPGEFEIWRMRIEQYIQMILDDFNRQDVMDLHRLVKERYDITSPEGYDLLLWGDLKTLFEPFHVLLMDNGIAIHMMIEKKYPLTQEMLSRMLNRRLEVDHESEMAFELLRFIRSQLKNLGEDCWELEAFYNLMLVQVCAAAED
ncbi:hypothetical protein Tco_0776218 [Tanacetum coccineum]